MQVDALLAAGDTAASVLIRAITYEGKIKMPPSGKLSAAEIGALSRWVGMGRGTESPRPFAIYR